MSRLQNVQEQDRHRISRIAVVFRAAVFLSGFIIIFAGLNYLFQPRWLAWNNYHTMNGFYDEPENTIETIFLGSSYCISGITPMELYEEYGICAYNLGTGLQPLPVSYYWVEEVSRLHSESLKTVVLDVSMMRKLSPQSYYRRGFDDMQLSPVKIRAAMACTDDFSEGISALFPLISYHERWTELEELDFTIGQYETSDSLRGHTFSTTKKYFSENTYDSFDVPAYYPEYGEEEQELTEEGLYYLKKMAEFCDENDLKLVLMRSPVATTWSVSLHNAVEAIADEYGLDFLDFNYSPLFEEVGHNYATDSTDGNHKNYYGTRKLTTWMGSYLTEECNATDVRNMEGYEFLEEQLAQYNKRVKDVAALEEITDPAEYLSEVMSNDDYTVFVTVKDEASKSLTEEQRQAFASLGLSGLSELDYRDSYLAVIDGGTVTYEKSDKARSAGSDGKISVNDFGNITEEEARAWRAEEEAEEQSLSCQGVTADGTEYVLTSGGKNHGNTASCKIDGKEHAADSRGLNIVIYDNAQKIVVDTVCFDTSASAERDSENLEAALEEALETVDNYTELPEDLQKLYLYNIRCEDARIASYQKKYAKDGGVFTYLSPFIEDESYAIFISAKDKEGDGFGAEVESDFAKLGLDLFSESDNSDSYIAVISGGEVIHEYRNQEEIPIKVSDALFEVSSESGILYTLKSGRSGSDKSSFITINDTEYRLKTSGIDVIIWNMVTDMEADTVNFDKESEK